MNNKNKKPVIAQILPSLESGGVERGTIDIAKALKKADFEPIVISSGGVLVYQLKEAGIKHIALPLKRKNPFAIFLNGKKLAQIIVENKIDLIHVRSRAPMWSAYFASKKTKVKLLSTVHGTYSLKFSKLKVFYFKKLYNSIMLKASRIIAVSDFIKDYLLQNYADKKTSTEALAKKITVIQRGADLNYFDAKKVSKNRAIDLINKWQLPEDKKFILMPARFTAWKGHEFLIEALAKVQNDFFCIFVGSDHGHKKFKRKIEQKIIEAGLAGKVKAVGLCKDMPAAYGISHFVLCPSVRPEAFGRISIEAQASSKIIVATKIGGSLETVIDGKTGFLVDAGNVEQLAQIIDNILTMPQNEIDEMAMAARKNIEENFSNEKMLSETIKVYKEML